MVLFISCDLPISIPHTVSLLPLYLPILLSFFTCVPISTHACTVSPSLGVTHAGHLHCLSFHFLLYLFQILPPHHSTDGPLRSPVTSMFFFANFSSHNLTMGSVGLFCQQSILVILLSFMFLNIKCVSCPDLLLRMPDLYLTTYCTTLESDTVLHVVCSKWNSCSPPTPVPVITFTTLSAKNLGVIFDSCLPLSHTFYMCLHFCWLHFQT